MDEKQLKDGQVVALAELLDRRGFCRTLGMSAAALTLIGLPGCGGGGGGNGGGQDDAAADLSQASNADLAGVKQDLAGSANACAQGLSDSGMTPAEIKLGTAVFQQADLVFICRDAGGLFALTAVCTHQGCSVNFVSQQAGFSCPCHGSMFSYTGVVTGQPAPSPLNHLALCLTSTKTVGYDPSTVVDAATRYDF